MTGRVSRALVPPGVLAALALLGPMAGACAGGGERHDAAALYRANCARCHGADGKGDRRSIGLYPNLDLTSSPLARAGSRGRGLIARPISEGYGAMPGFGHRLSAEDLQSLTDYVLRLAQGNRER